MARNAFYSKILLVKQLNRNNGHFALVQVTKERELNKVLF